MADDKNNTGRPDRSRISLSGVYEVKHWTDKYGVAAERLQAAVEAFGNSPDAAGKWLRQHG